MELNPYLTFNGQCEAAFKFYERCLGGKIEFMLTHGESPMAQQTPPEWRNKIMHARLAVQARSTAVSAARAWRSAPRSSRTSREPHHPVGLTPSR